MTSEDHSQEICSYLVGPGILNLSAILTSSARDLARIFCKETTASEIFRQRFGLHQKAASLAPKCNVT
jgi:hypothetical protein